MDTACLAHRLTDTEREAFEEDGFMIVRDAMPTDQVARVANALDDVVCWRQRIKNERIQIAVDRAQARLPLRRVPPRLLVFRDERALVIGEPLFAHPALTDLVDLPTTLPKVWSLLGWNIHVYDQAARVTFSSAASNTPARASAGATAFGFHRDGGRINAEAGSTIPRLAVKVGLFASDVDGPGRGNLYVVPGSHRWPEPLPEDDALARAAVPIRVPAGSAVIFDARIAHKASTNTSNVVRKAVFLGYALRWVYSMGERRPSRRRFGDDPIRSQLLGAGTAYGRFFPASSEVPLRAWLAQHDRAGSSA